jgi:hypothetical protein
MRSRLFALILPLAAVPALHAEPDFQREVRPILSNNCFRCHGPDEKERKGGKDGLRLDIPEGAAEDLGGYKAVVPGKPEESEIIKRLTTSDRDDLMPPAKTGKKLSAHEIDVVRQWIKAGGQYRRHWSYEPPRRPAIPQPSGVTIRNPIDAFIFDRLQREGLQPQPEADRYTLARRAALDLTGLPPTVEEVDAFVADTAPDAYEQYVDRQLAKPAYGEHWARMWLDLARYADSNGYADDKARSAWAFRDYVIHSLNENKPFDQFTIEQLAGDLLPNPTEEQLVATTFHRNTMTNTEGGTNREEFRNAAVIDRVNTTLAVWMGTSMACAQCHSHKYDPISQKEYFQVFAILNNTEDADNADNSPLLPFYTDAQKKQRADAESELAALEAKLKAPSAAVIEGAAKWAREFPVQLEWKAPRPDEAASSAGSKLTVQEDASVLAPPAEAKKDTYTVRIGADGLHQLSALRIEALPDPSLPAKGPGNANGNFVVTRVRASIVPPATAAGPRARYVRIELPGKEKILQIAEVQVFSSGENIALRGEAKQSSTYSDAVAAHAIDGRTDGEYAKGSIAHTNTEENPWWEVDLKSTASIDRIVVFNRAESGDRIAGFRLVALDEQRQPVWEKAGNPAPKREADFPLNGAQELRFASASADFSQKDFNPADVLIDEHPKTLRTIGWAIGGATGKAHALTLVTAKQVELPEGATVAVTIEQQSVTEKATLGHFRLSLTADPHAAEYARTPAAVLTALAVPEEKRDAAQRALLLDHYARQLAPEFKTERARFAALRSQLDALKPETVPIMRELGANARRTTHVQIRGNFLNVADEVTAGVPSAWNPPPAGEPMNRLTLAKWIIDPANPLTARVLVNRLWETIFGLGIVRTSEEFGSQGELPSHPELLDWLATEIVAQHWDMKALVRLMATSAAYRQSSKVTSVALEKDSDNRLLSRGPRVRLSAEMVRDQALAVSGLLSGKMYGPSVRPIRPTLGLSAAFGSGLDWATSAGEDRYRRALYTEWRRTSPYPSMATFDATSREICTLRRNRTNTPLQALVTLNDPVYVETAQALARRAVEAGSNTRERLGSAFRLVLARPPSEVELDKLARLQSDALAVYSQDPVKAKQLATDPLGPLPAGADAAELASWTTVANVLLNLDETLMKR